MSFKDIFASVFSVDNGSTPLFTDRVDVHKACISSINFFPSAVEEELKLLKPTTYFIYFI